MTVSPERGILRSISRRKALELTGVFGLGYAGRGLAETAIQDPLTRSRLPRLVELYEATGEKTLVRTLTPEQAKAGYRQEGILGATSAAAVALARYMKRREIISGK